MNEPKPKKITRPAPAQLKILWDDGLETTIRLDKLRENCPCASCTSDKPMSGLQKMVENSLKEKRNDLQRLETVGNYALRPVWGDGHDIGIYRFEHIRKICEEAK